MTAGDDCWQRLNRTDFNKKSRLARRDFIISSFFPLEDYWHPPGDISTLQQITPIAVQASHLAGQTRQPV